MFLIGSQHARSVRHSAAVCQLRQPLHQQDLLNGCTLSGVRRQTKLVQKLLHRRLRRVAWEDEMLRMMMMMMMLKCCFTSTETIGLLGTGAQDVHLDFHTDPELL